MRLTYQVRLLTVLAIERRSQLVLRLPRKARLSRDLREFVREHAPAIKVERIK
jgi:hypothetical protein